jgi:hypothetical protein
MRLTSLALVAAIGLSAAAPSFAQRAPTAAPTGAPGAPTGRTWQRPDPAQRAERRAERLRAVLQLRPDQEPALRTLVAAMQPTAEQRERREAERTEMRNLPTPQRLDRMQARSAERQARFAQRAEAIKRFYAQLTPAQQRAFDALPMEHGGRGGRGEHGFGRGKRPDFG